MSKKLADVEGEYLPELEHPDVKALIHLLEYGRLKGIRIGPMVQIVDTVVQVRDIRQTEGRKDIDDKDLDVRDFWRNHGHEEK